jgi:hypothetical protein
MTSEREIEDRLRRYIGLARKGKLILGQNFFETLTEAADLLQSRRSTPERDAVIEECARVAEALGERFDEGSQKFISSEPDKHDQMQARGGGCNQAAKAIRSLKSPPREL